MLTDDNSNLSARGTAQAGAVNIPEQEFSHGQAISPFPIHYHGLSAIIVPNAGAWFALLEIDVQNKPLLRKDGSPFQNRVTAIKAVKTVARGIAKGMPINRAIFRMQGLLKK